VSIVVKGTSTGTITDTDGRFTINVADDAILVFSFIGYATEEVSINGRSNVDVTMAIDATELGEVVVTALGISRDKKSLTYSAEQLDGKELTQAKDASFINALAGKTAGIQINRSGSGAGGSTRVVLRGNSSTRDNNVLYVIDGVPMANYSPSQPTDVWGQNADGSGGAGRDGGDAISNLNPEDIESMTILKGASAAALYGSQAANGVILITTKSGESGTTNITCSSNFTPEKVNTLPDFQNKYGNTGDKSWGPATSSSDHVEDFFETGKTWINSISLSGGNKKAQSYFSYANTNSDGVLPSNSLNKHNISFKETATFFNDKLKITAGTNIISQKAENRANSGMYSNPLTGLYLFPRGNEFSDAENFESYNDGRLLSLQNWHTDLDLNQNPYWLVNRVTSEDQRNRTITNVSTELALTDNLKLRLRGTHDQTHDRYSQKSFAGTNPVLSDRNGRYFTQTTKNIQTYGEAVLSYDKTFETLSFSGLIGTTVNDVRRDIELLDSKGAGVKEWGHVYGLQYANVFSAQNVAQPGATLSQVSDYQQLQAVFGSINLGYKGMLYLDITARNDWSSTLAYTDNVSFFYPSFGLTGIISEMIQLPASVDLLKARMSYANVGNAVNAFDTNILNPIGIAGFAPPNAVVPNGSSLSPESQTSLELGLELGMLNNRFNFDLTYYDNTTEDQRILIDAPSGSGFNKYIINAGEISNKGIELSLSGSPIQTSNFSWDVGLHYTKNTNKVEKLHESLEDGIFNLSEPGVNGYAMAIREGGTYGELYGTIFLEDGNGNIVVDEASGAPQKETGQKIGDINPDYLMSLSNSLEFKNIKFNFLIDGRFGGDVMSMTEALMDEYGVSQTTASDRDNGGVQMAAVTVDSDGNVGGSHSGTHDPETFYSAVGGRAGITGNYIYSATNIRLREMSISYPLPVSNINWLESATFSIVGRNLFFFKNDAPFDPDISMGTGAGLQGVDVFSVPSTRSLGFNLSVKF
jgi:TonB-linked SusC/RagA family outer membrane protein